MSFMTATSTFEIAPTVSWSTPELPLEAARRLARQGPHASAWSWLLLPGLALLLGMGVLLPMLALGYVAAALIGSVMGVRSGLTECRQA